MQLCRPQPLAAALALVLALTLWGQAAQAQTLVLSNLVVDNQSGALAARFGVALDSLAEVSDALQSGMTLALTCRGKLAVAGGMFSSPQVAAAEMTCRLKYDQLTREYSLTLPTIPLNTLQEARSKKEKIVLVQDFAQGDLIRCIAEIPMLYQIGRAHV